MSNLQTDTITPLGSTIILAGGITVGSGAYFSRGVTMASTLDVTGAGSFGGAITASTAPTIGNHLTNKTYVDSLIGTDRESVPVGGIFLVNLSNNFSPSAPTIGTAYPQTAFTKGGNVYTFTTTGGSGLPTGTYRCTSYTTVTSGINGTALFVRIT